MCLIVVLASECRQVPCKNLAHICFYCSERIFYNFKTRRKAKEEATVFSLSPPLTEFSTGNLRESFFVHFESLPMPANSNSVQHSCQGNVKMV